MDPDLQNIYKSGFRIKNCKKGVKTKPEAGYVGLKRH
jgi:hypothetical protein